MKNYICLLLFSFSFSLVAVSQENNICQLFSKSFEIVNEKGKKDSFKGQVLKGKRNGMGFLMQKNNYLYAGDFYRNEKTGYGIIFAIGNNYIENCDSCTIYVGNWLGGVKSGFGTCYKSDGNILYQGRFEEDKPIEQYPYVKIGKPKRISCIEFTNGDIFLGEIDEENINGYGVIIFKDGDLWLSNFKDGEKNGVGLYLLYNGEWETLNFSNGDYNVISSSTNYQEIDTQRRDIFKTSLSEAMGYFAEAANIIVESKANFQASENKESYHNDNIYDVYTDESHSSNSSLQSQYENWERRAKANYNSLTNLGLRGESKDGDKGGTTGQGMSSSNYSQMKKALREAQREMKNIRMKAKKNGINITQSKWETAVVKY